MYSFLENFEGILGLRNGGASVLPCRIECAHSLCQIQFAFRACYSDNQIAEPAVLNINTLGPG